jgi:Histidine kinase/Y_Y_Y domain/Two component regulator propeller
VIKRCYKTFFLSFLLLCIYPSYAQELVYKHYDLQDGLASSTIHSIFQDKDGFLWIGTESGLCRYDGTHFKTYTVKDGLPGNEVFRVFQDSKDRLWLHFYNNSIAYIYHGKIYNQENDSLLRKIRLESRLFGVAEDGEGNIGLCDNKTIYIIPTGNGAVKRIESPNDSPFNLIQLYTNNNGALIACASSALYKVENFRLHRIRTLAKQDENFAANEILFHPHYTVYSYMNNRVIELKDTVIRIPMPLYSLKYSPVSDSVFSINTIDGAYLFNIINYKMVKILPGFKVTNTLIDKENNLWIGTLSRGLFKVSSQVIVNNKINDQQNDIYFITKDNTKIIVANNNLGIFEYNKNRFTKRPILGARGKVMLKTFYYEKLNDGNYFLAHAMGFINIENGNAKKEVVAHVLKHVSGIDNDHVLVSINNGVYVIRKNDLTVTDTIWSRKSLSAFKTNDSVLVGTIAGLFILKESNGRYLVVDSLLTASIIGPIMKTADNCIWVSTNENGLYCLKDGKIAMHYSDTSGLPSNNTRSIYIRDNDVWLGTDKGLVKITREQGISHIKKYSTSDGLPSNIINSIYADANIIYIGTPEGLCHFDERLIETTSICNLVLTDVRIEDSLVGLSSKYFLNRNQRFVIGYSGISFRSEQEMTYRYMIGGLDNSWRSTNQNSLEFTALPYGDYELKIVAINKQGKESLPLKIPFHIRTPFYKATWFLALMVLVLVSGILFYNTRRLNRIKKKQLQKLQQEIKILELEQMTLLLQMNPHFIFNCISTVQQLVTENDAQNTHKFITSFSDLLRQTLDNAPELFIPLNEEIKFLNNYFELERIRLEDRFSYLVSTTGIKNTDHLHVPNMVIQPFAENAIRHGIRYKKDGKGYIEVAFEQQDKLLRCTITDNGIGRQRAEQIKKELGIKHTSKGMSITLKRVESLKMLTHSHISIEIEDMKDGNCHASGTKVIIDFFKPGYQYDKNSYNR